MSVVLAAAAAEQSAGWGHLVALVGAGVVFWAGSSAHQRWLSTREDHSPTAIEGTKAGAKPQVKAVGGTNGTTSEKRPTDLDVFVAQQVGKTRTTDIVKAAQRHYQASRRTVMRSISRAKNGGTR